jgi:uncharacterized protein (DUF3820 family)
LDKVHTLYPNVGIDEDLRGKSRSFSVEGKEDLSPELIKFGKYSGKTITDIAEIDFKYLLWLEDNVYSSETRELIGEIPQVIEYKKKLKSDTDKMWKERWDSFVTEGDYEVYFHGNPNGCLAMNVANNYEDVKFNDDCPQSIKDRFEALISVYKEGGPRVEPLVYTTGYIGESECIFVFTQHKTVQGMYPYNMGFINGKPKRTKGKKFVTNLIPIGYTHLGDETKPMKQVLIVK